MDQNDKPTAEMQDVSPLPFSVAPEVGNYDIEEIIRLASASPSSQITEDMIRVATPPLPSPLTCPFMSQYSLLNSADIPIYSPTYSSSSLSEPPTEPNSPTLFHTICIKPEAAEDSFGIDNEVADHRHTVSSTIPRTPSGRGTRARINGGRGVDPCADEEWVVALRVAHAADQTGMLSDDPNTTQTRRTSGRLNRARNMPPVAKSPLASTSLSGAPNSKKRGRKNNRTHLSNITPDGDIMAIKKEIFETGDEIGVNNYIPVASLTGKRRRGRPPMKKRKVDSAPVAVPELTSGQHDYCANEEERANILAVDGKTLPKKEKKRLKRYTYVTEELEKIKPDNRTRGSVPPNFTFRYAIPHTSFTIDKEPLRSSRYWSEGAGGPGNFKPIGDVFQRKDGLLTDVVSIIESRLRPRKPRRPRTSLNLERELEAGESTRKRTLEERDSDTGESSDDGCTVTDDEDLGEDDDETDDDLDSDSEDIDLSASLGEDEHSPGNTPPKRQKLNTGGSLSTGATKKIPGKKHPKQNKQSGIAPQDIDKRIWLGAITKVDNMLMVPRACTNCKELRQFCNRNLPCSGCVTRGKDCQRSPGLQLARRYSRRGVNRTSLPDDISSPTPKTKRLWVKKEIMAKVKKERDTKVATIINLVDPQEGKPPGIRRPEVWCESRQELCESLPYYRSYQSGCYGHDGLVHGYLLDGFAAPRDYVDGKVVISHSGGKSTADEDGQRRLLTNQTSEDKVIKYLLANMKNQLPLVMVMGTQCASSPSKLPHRYCVMDWFKVTAGWAERDPRSRYTRWKFRFEKLDTATDGWWAASPTLEYDTPTEMVKASCNSCKTESPHIYEEGWMCLKPECVKFWTLNGSDAPADIKYTDNFLRCRTPWPTEFLTAPNPLGPPLNFNRDVFFDGGDVSRVFWKGMCCPECGRLNCREFWVGWRCLSCDFKFDPPRTIFDATRLADPHRPVFTGPAIPANICHDDISYERYVRDGMTVIQYQLGDCGTVTHILANQKTNARPMDADWLFREYQSADMPFKRFILGNHKAQGRLLTQQFTFNCGAPYKFIVDVESHPFDKSPPVVARALEVIHDRVNLVHPEAQFNEVLNVGYFEKQKMDYHDDGEAGLGETVASISLGAPARMRFRVKARYSRERHCWTTRPATPPHYRLIESPVKEEPKNDEDLEFGDEDEDEDPERNEEVIGGQQPPSPPGRNSKKLYKGRVKLDLCLNHGDVMVMKGRDIQKYWEHSVIPQGLFRIAATARLITENHPGVLNKAKAEIVEVDKSAKTPDEGGQQEEHKPLSDSQTGVPPSLEEAPILEKPAPLEPTMHLETTPIQTVPIGIVGDCSQRDVSLGNGGPYPQIQQLNISGSDRIHSIPSPTAYQNADQNAVQNGLPWETLGGQNKDKSGNKTPQSSTPEYPIPPTIDKILSRAPESSNDGMNTTTPGLQCNPPYINGLGMALSNAQSGSYSSITTNRNPFSGPAPILPNPSVCFSGTLNQGPPRFGTANNLHPMDQLAGLSNNASFPPHTPETFSANPQHSPFDGRGSTPVQLMPIMPNATQILYRIPGLTTLWPEIGNVGIPTGQKFEDPNKTNI